jgi:hypothetical protein
VWRIRGDVIDRLGLKDKLYPKFHTDLTLGYHVLDAVQETMVHEP